MAANAPSDLDRLVAHHPACVHPFLSRLFRAEPRSEVRKVFAQEYSVLRRHARALDACCANANQKFIGFVATCGVNQAATQHALPGTRLACDGLRTLQRDPRFHDGSLWALEQIGRHWAKRWQAEASDCGNWNLYWEDLAKAEDWVRTPLKSSLTQGSWFQGVRQTLERTAFFLDGLESSVGTLYAA